MKNATNATLRLENVNPAVEPAPYAMRMLMNANQRNAHHAKDATLKETVNLLTVESVVNAMLSLINVKETKINATLHVMSLTVRNVSGCLERINLYVKTFVLTAQHAKAAVVLIKTAKVFVRMIKSLRAIVKTINVRAMMLERLLSTISLSVQKNARDVTPTTKMITWSSNSLENNTCGVILNAKQLKSTCPHVLRENARQLVLV